MADVGIDFVKNGDEPQLDYLDPHPVVVFGLLFPDTPNISTVSKLRFVGNGVSSGPDLLTQSEFDDFRLGKIFFVTYANISYKDFFGVKHWTRLCEFNVQGSISGSYSAQKCANYGDVDTN
jgi:hypothetical protein